MTNISLSSILLRFGWLIITVFSIFLFSITTLYFYYWNDAGFNFLAKKQDVVFSPFWRTAFYIHITGGMLALLVGPFQFIRKLRSRYIKWHRSIGKLYLAAILFLAGPSGLFMAFYAEGGGVAVAGFSMMALLWIYTTYMAYETIRKKKVEAHKKWMTRSFALTFAAVTLRLYVPIASAVFHIPGFYVEASSAWVSWVPNLIVAELILLIFPKKL
jgi:uncharacterized membrane protein